MGVIPTRYSPVHTEPDGRVTVELAGDHPGVTDPVYRARRDELAAQRRIVGVQGTEEQADAAL